MHFYCFLLFCQQITRITLIIHDLLFLSCCHQMTQIKLTYLSSYHSCHSMMTRRPSRSSNLVPRFAVVGVVLLAILADGKPA